jgi:hypothetical protein
LAAAWDHELAIARGLHDRDRHRVLALLLGRSDEPQELGVGRGAGCRDRDDFRTSLREGARLVEDDGVE